LPLQVENLRFSDGEPGGQTQDYVSNMLEKSRRALNRKEQEILKELIGPSAPVVTLSNTLRWLTLWLAILTLCVIGTIKAESLPGGPALVIPVTFVIGLLAFYFAYLVASTHFHISRHVRRFQGNIPRLKADLENGNALVSRVAATRVLTIEQSEDEGSAYIYDLADGTCLFLRGQDYDLDDHFPWPARRFEIVHTASGWFLGVSGAEEALEPARIIPMSEMPESFWSSQEPASETILRGSPEEVLRSLGHPAHAVHR
jgi:hypothetical protein